MDKFIFSVVSLAANFALALPPAQPMLKDLRLIVQNAEFVSSLSSSPSSRLVSIKFAGTEKCLDGPRIYSISLERSTAAEAQVCTRTVTVGSCFEARSAKVTLNGPAVCTVEVSE